MSTTDQPTIDAEATPADRLRWAAPGVEHTTAAWPDALVDAPQAPSTAPVGHDSAPAGAAGAAGAAGVAGVGAGIAGVGAGVAGVGVAGAAGAAGVGAGIAGVGDEGPDRQRESAQVSQQAAVDWRSDLRSAVSVPAGHVHPVVTAVASCVTALDSVHGAGVGTLTAREIRTLLLAIAHVIAAAVGLKLRLLAAGETQRVADLTGATSTAAWWAHLTRANRPDAGGEVRLAKDLDRRYSLLADALARGRMSLEQLKVCVTALRRLPKDVPADKLAACQHALVQAAQELTPRELKRVGRRLWEVIDPDGAEAKDGKDLQDEEERARAKAYFTSWRNGDGTTGFRGKLPDVQADMLLKLLHAYASPRRWSNPNITTAQPDDTRHPDDGSGSTDGGEDDDRGGHDDHGSGGCDGSARDGCLDDESPEEMETGRTIPHPVRLGHALMELVERIPKQAIPYSGGVAATIVVTIREDQLRTGLGTAILDTGTAISAGQTRRLACEAGLLPMVLGGPSQPLDVGRKSRLHTEAQRTVMSVIQGGTCAIDGCDRPAAWSEGHHLKAWSEGGETSVEDGILVCGFHHHLAHHPDWRLIHRDGTYLFVRISR